MRPDYPAVDGADCTDVAHGRHGYVNRVHTVVRTMTKRLECVVEGCDATIEAESEDEVMSQAQSHAAKEHPDLDLDPETISDIRSNIKDV